MTVHHMSALLDSLGLELQEVVSQARNNRPSPLGEQPVLLLLSHFLLSFPLSFLPFFLDRVYLRSSGWPLITSLLNARIIGYSNMISLFF